MFFPVINHNVFESSRGRWGHVGSIKTTKSKSFCYMYVDYFFIHLISKLDCLYSFPILKNLKKVD
jgi:hypothetical protein